MPKRATYAAHAKRDCSERLIGLSAPIGAHNKQPLVAQARVDSFVLLLLAVIGIARPTFAADTPSVELALKFRPVQKDVEYETPKANQFKLCKVTVERQGKTSGWAVTGPAGQLLRRYIDTNGDNVVDQWRYFQHGLEVYRDIDSNSNNKVDQCRWVNTGGSRWGVDSNEDGRIDSWKRLSAEEASRVAIQALVAGDAAALKQLMINTDDIRKLGISREYAEKLAKASSNVAGSMRASLSKTRSLNRQSRWMRFDGAMPSVIPAEDGKATADLTVYENVMAIVETSGKTSFVQIGELVRVAEVWKLTQVPQPMEGESVQITQGGILMQPALLTQATATAPGMSPAAQKLLEQLQTLDTNSPRAGASRAVLAKYNSDRGAVLRQLVAISKTEEDRDQWTRQMIDGLATSAQTAGYEEALNQLRAIEAEVRQKSAGSPIVSYATYRRLLAEYSLGIQKASGTQQQKIQEKWYNDLEKFVQTFPSAEDTPEAMMQLGIGQEFRGKIEDARKWYSQLAAKHSKTPAGKRATGALRRLALNGQPLNLTGPSLNGGSIDVGRFRGRVVLVYFWATWCKPCTEDLPQIRALYEKHHNQGFEIVGINLDSTPEPIKPFVAQFRIAWPQIYQPGGLTSPLAHQYGIISLPTMFLVGQDGKVLNRSVSAADLKKQIPELLKKK